MTCFFIRPASCAAPTLTTYRVEVKTADKFAAGTDANVSVILYGKTGDSGKQALVGSGKNLFERNEVSAFDLELADLGKLVKMRIEHDNSGLGASYCTTCSAVVMTICALCRFRARIFKVKFHHQD